MGAIENKASRTSAQLMAIEVVSELMASTSPQHLGEALTEHLRELTGAKTVMVMIHKSEPLLDELLYVSPLRRSTLFSPDELNNFCYEKTAEELPLSPQEFTDKNPLRAILLTAGVKSVVRYPLRVGGESVAILILLDLPELDRISETDEIIHLLAPPMALAIKNAMSFRQIEQQKLELEKRVKERTVELSQSEERLRLSTELANVAVWEYDFNTNSMSRSKNHDGLYGLEIQAEWDFNSFVNAIHPKDRELSTAIIGASALTGGPDEYNFDFRVIHSDDSIHWLNMAGQVVSRDFAGRGVLVRGCLIDVTERKQFEESLASSEKELRQLAQNLTSANENLGALIHCISDWVWEVDSAGRYTYSSSQVETLLGYTPDEIIGKTPFDLMDPVEAELFRIKFNDIYSHKSFIKNLENWNITKDGRKILLCTNGVPIIDEAGSLTGYRGVDVDLTASRHLEEQLRQSQKMEAIGQLAGGVAHDFNNILTVIMGYANLLQINSGLSPTQKEAADQIIASSERAAHLTRGLLAFSRKQVLNVRKENLDNIVSHVEKFLVRIIGEDIKLKSIHNGKAIQVNVDSGQIEQVLINLATNARDAMKKGGILTLETGTQEVDVSLLQGDDYVKPGRYGRITVTDTGIGMDKESCARMFEPFYTTKEVGKGTGLGMSIAYGIIKQHNGFINVYSEPGVGTTFRIYLPIAETEQSASMEKKEEVAPRGGTETILLAEDDAAVSKLVVTVLEEYGYTVIRSVDGQDAVEKFSANSDKINMVLMDMIMPKKNGKEAYEEIIRLKSNVKVLYSSGYTSDFIQNRGVSEEGIELLMKPVHPMELLRKVREVLDSK